MLNHSLELISRSLAWTTSHHIWKNSSFKSKVWPACTHVQNQSTVCYLDLRYNQAFFVSFNYMSFIRLFTLLAVSLILITLSHHNCQDTKAIPFKLRHTLGILTLSIVYKRVEQKLYIKAPQI